MRLSLVAPLVVLAACALETKVHSADPETLAGKGLSIAVLDVHDESGVLDPALLQMNLTRALMDEGFRGASTEAVRTRTEAWTAKKAAASAQSRGKAGALTVEVTGEKGKIRAVIRIHAAEDARLLYHAEVRGSADGLTESDLAEALIAPLRDL